MKWICASDLLTIMPCDCCRIFRVLLFLSCPWLISLSLFYLDYKTTTSHSHFHTTSHYLSTPFTLPFHTLHTTSSHHFTLPLHNTSHYLFTLPLHTLHTFYTTAGESEWNKQKRFTGWVDADLSERGRREVSTRTFAVGTRTFTVCVVDRLLVWQMVECVNRCVCVCMWCVCMCPYMSLHVYVVSLPSLPLLTHLPDLTYFIFFAHPVRCYFWILFLQLLSIYYLFFVLIFFIGAFYAPLFLFFNFFHMIYSILYSFFPFTVRSSMRPDCYWKEDTLSMWHTRPCSKGSKEIHTHIYIYVYICVCVCVCMFACEYLCKNTTLHAYTRSRAHSYTLLLTHIHTVPFVAIVLCNLFAFFRLHFRYLFSKSIF